MTETRVFNKTQCECYKKMIDQTKSTCNYNGFIFIY